MGIVGRVACDGEPVLLPSKADILKDRDYNPSWDAYGLPPEKLSSLLCAPLRDPSGRIIAVIQLANKREGSSPSLSHPQRFNASDLMLLRAAVIPAGLVLHNSMLFGSTIEGKKRLEGLVTISRSISTELNLDQLVQVGLVIFLLLL